VTRPRKVRKGNLWIKGGLPPYSYWMLRLHAGSVSGVPGSHVPICVTGSAGSVPCPYRPRATLLPTGTDQAPHRTQPLTRVIQAVPGSHLDSPGIIYQLPAIMYLNLDHPPFHPSLSAFSIFPTSSQTQNSQPRQVRRASDRPCEAALAPSPETGWTSPHTTIGLLRHPVDPRATAQIASSAQGFPFVCVRVCPAHGGQEASPQPRPSCSPHARPPKGRAPAVFLPPTHTSMQPLP
jgi:hypothetical protein